jgi:chromosomal replication initiator protein
MSPTSASDVWQCFLYEAAPHLSAHVLEAWLRPIRCSRIDPSAVVLEVRDRFAKDWLTDHYLSFIRDNVSRILGRSVGVEFAINPSLPRPEPTPTPEPKTVAEAVTEGAEHRRRRLNPRYSFDTFVCGPSNQLAVAAAKAVADRPGHSYNPLFLYGRVGLGKTHLLTAIGHHVLDQRPDCRVIYTSSEQFTNEVVNAVLGNKLGAFQARYRDQCDVLLIDDIQFIARKERTQNEFFHIFNALYNSERQIVVTSDMLPHEIQDIDDRVRNRFQFGLIADIQAPEVETRVAILRRKAAEENITLSDDVAFFLAEHVRSNVRELEGALVRVLAHASLTNAALTPEYAQRVLADILVERFSSTSVEAIQKVVAGYFNVRVSDLKSRRRQHTLIRPRQVAMYLARKHSGASFPDLGSRFGNKDHTTIMSAVRRVEAMLEGDAALRSQIGELERQLHA